MSQARNECVVITGANRGIGLEFTRRYAADTERVVACCRDPQGAERLRNLADEMGNIDVRRLDVTDGAQIASLAQALGAHPVDVLINNAGVYGPRESGMPVDTTAWARVLEVNSMAPLKLAEALLDNIAASDRKVIANLTSKMGSIADNGSGGSYIYRTSKAALNAAMRSLAHDVRERGVTVLLLHPGWVQTDMGGPNALIDTDTSVKGMKEIIDGASLQISGQFLSYDGSEIPW